MKVGERYKSNRFGWVEVIAYKGKREVTVKFDTGEIIVSESDCVRKGLITPDPRITTKELFVNKANRIYNGQFEYNFEFHKMCDKENIHCTVCGGNFVIRLDTHLKGKGCPHCRAIKQKQEVINRKLLNSESKLLATNNLLADKLKENLIRLLSNIKFNYSLNDGRVCAECKECCAKYSVALTTKKVEQFDCYSCMDIERRKERFKSYVRRCNIKHNTSYDYIASINGKFLIRHKTCGNTYWQNIDSHLSANYGKGVGCPKCAAYGFDETRLKSLYLLESESYFKIGITNRNATDRSEQINKWCRKNKFNEYFEPVMEWLINSNAREIEKSIHNYFKSNGYLTPETKFDGYTESFVKDNTYSKEQVISTIENLIK